MRAAKESGEVEFGATSLASLVREGDRTFLLIAKRRLDDGGVWCSFRFKNSCFIEDDTFGDWGKTAPSTTGPVNPADFSDSPAEDRPQAVESDTGEQLAGAIHKGDTGQRQADDAWWERGN